jgi:hypothetical protein
VGEKRQRIKRKARYVSMLKSTRVGEKLRGPLVYYEDGGRKLFRNTGPHLAETKILAPEQPDVQN